MCGWSSRPMAFISRFKARDRQWIFGPRWRQDLESDDPIQLEVQGLIDHAHGATTQPSQQVVLAELFRKRGGCVGRCLARSSGLIQHALRARNRLPALQFVEIGIRSNRSSQQPDQRIVGIRQSTEFRSARGTGFQMDGNRLGSPIGKLSDRVILQFTLVWAPGRGHSVACSFACLIGQRHLAANARPRPPCAAGE